MSQKSILILSNPLAYLFDIEQRSLIWREMTESSGLPADATELLEPYTQLRIPFVSQSDAHLAQLLLQHGLSRHHFNLILNTLRNPSFSIRDVTLRSASDIDEHVSEHRRNLAKKRSGGGLMKNGPSRQTDRKKTVSLIFNLVLDFMLSEHAHFSYEADNPPNESGVQANPYEARHRSLCSDLKSMSLVHRTWTLPAQRALSRRVVLMTKRHLRSFALSPACGTSVRELAYKINKTDACTFFHDGSAALEHWAVFASVLSRLPNLRWL